MKIKRYYRCKPDEGGDYKEGQFAVGIVTTDRVLRFFQHPSSVTRRMLRKVLRRVRKQK